MPTPEDLTPGQQAWIASRAGSTAVAAITAGTRSAVELVPADDPAQPWRARFTITDEDGRTVTTDEWPPGATEDPGGVSPEQQAYIDAMLTSAEPQGAAVIGTRTSWELVESDDPRNPVLVRWTVTDEAGCTGTLDETPERSPSEQAEAEAVWALEDQAEHEAQEAQSLIYQQEREQAAAQKFAADVEQHPLVVALRAENQAMRDALEWLTEATLPLLFPGLPPL